MKNPKTTAIRAASALAAALVLGTAAAIPAADRTRDLMPAPAQDRPRGREVPDHGGVRRRRRRRAGRHGPGTPRLGSCSGFRAGRGSSSNRISSGARPPAPEVALAYACERAGRLEPNEDESYRLTVAPDRVSLAAKTDLGVLQGARDAPPASVLR